MGKVSFVLFAALIYGATAQAERVFSSTSPHSVSGALGFMAPGMNEMAGTNGNGQSTTVNFKLSGFLGLGGDYDYMAHKDFSFGAFFRYYSTSASYNNVSYKNQIMTLGPDLKGYFSTDTWGCYFGTGFGLMSPSYTGVSINQGYGVMMVLGFLHKLNDKTSIGFESLRMMGLSGPIYGTPIEDYMAKVRFQL